MLKYTIKNRAYDKLLIFIVISFIYSYGIENIIESKKDLTAPLLFMSVSVILFGIITNIVNIKFYSADAFIFILIIYITFRTFNISQLNVTLKVILGSVMPYFIGRFIHLKKDNSIFFKKVLNFYSIIIISKLIINFGLSATKYRVTFGDAHPIALGELLGIFVLVNILHDNKLFSTFKGSIFSILGFIAILLLLGSRGAFFSTLLTIILIFLISNINRSKAFFIITILILCYITILNNNVLIEMFPSLGRFTFNNILHDPAVVGSQLYMGRKDFYLLSLNSIKNSPIFGVGMGIVYSHNFFLEILSSLGIIGLIIFTFFITSLITILHKFKSNLNLVLLALLIQSFIYRQSSFALDSYKTLFMFAGMIVTDCIYNEEVKKVVKKKNKESILL